MNILASLASTILPGIFTTVDKAIPDKDLAAKLKGDIQLAVLNTDADALKEQAGIVTAEAQGESWLQRNWRPLTMLVFVFVVFNNYILAPYLALFNAGWSLKLDTPPDLWALIKIGMGGYIVGRSGEKIMKAYAGKN